MACKSKKIRHSKKRMSTGGILSSVAAGAGAGFAFGGGPLGAVIGGLGGLAQGLFSNSKEKQAAEAQAEMEHQQARMAAMGHLGMTAGLGNQTAVFAQGGSIPYSETVELERGEPYMTPDGNIEFVPTNAPTHAQGGVIMDLPVGTKVLGNKKAFKGKQFKELGRKLSKTQDTYETALDRNPGSVESKTAEIMLGRIKDEYNNLFLAQGEDIGMDTYKKGGKIYIKPSKRGSLHKHLGVPKGKKIPISKLKIKSTDSPAIRKKKQFAINARKWRKGRKGMLAGEISPDDYTLGSLFRSDPRYANYRYFNNPSSGSLFYLSSENSNPNPVTSSDAIREYNQYMNSKLVSAPDMGTDIFSSEDLGTTLLNAGVTPEGGALSGNSNFNYLDPYSTSGLNLSPSNERSTFGKGLDWLNTNRGSVGSILGTAASLAPVAYNLFQGNKSPESINASALYNPYNDEIRSTLRDRRYNVQPELAANRLGQATYNRKIRESGPSVSQYLANLSGGQLQRSRADAAVYAKKQNIDNQYLADQARTDLYLGKDIAATNRYVEDINARNRATRRGFTSAGLSQLSNFAQNQMFMSNQKLRDGQRTNILNDLIINYLLTNDYRWQFKD